MDPLNSLQLLILGKRSFHLKEQIHASNNDSSCSTTLELMGGQCLYELTQYIVANPNLEKLVCDISHLKDHEFREFCGCLPEGLKTIVFRGTFQDHWLGILQERETSFKCDFTSCTGIEHIHLTTASDRQAQALTAALPCTIRTFTFNDSLSETGLVTVIKQLPATIEEYTFNGALLRLEGVLELSKKLSHCKRLSLNNCQQIPAQGWQTLFSQLFYLEFLDISRSYLNEQGVPSSLPFGHLKVLKINDCPQLTPQSWSTLFKALPSKQLVEISLSGASFTDAEVPILAKALTQCVKLNLNNCLEITKEGLLIILKSLPSVELLELARAQPDSAGALELSKKITNCLHFNLSFCHSLTAKEWALLLKKLSVEIKELYLSSTSLDDDSAQFFPKLEKCDICELSRSENLSCKGWELIFNALSNTGLKKLDISDNFFEKIHNFPRLSQCISLNLSHNLALTTESWQAIFKMLAPPLQELKLSDCSLDEEAVKFFPSISSLNKLDLSDNFLSPQDYDPLFFALPNQIEELNLANTSFKNQQIHLLTSKLAACTKLDVSNCTGPLSDGWTGLFLALSPKLNSLNLQGSSFESSKEVNLENCQISTKGWRKIFLAIPHYVEKLNFKNSSIDNFINLPLFKLTCCKIIDVRGCTALGPEWRELFNQNEYAHINFLC